MATQEDLDSLDQRIQDHGDYLRKLQQLAEAVTHKQPQGWYAYGRGLAQFNKDRQAKLLEIERQAKRSQQDYRDLNRERQKTAGPGAKQAAPLSEAGQLTQLERERKQGQDIADQGPEKRKAESQLEQQKAADAASKPALGASIPTKTGGAQPQSLADLLTKFQMKPDRQTGEYVFSRPNEEGVLTPGQTRANAQLTAALKSSGLQPEQVFGVGVPAPIFDPKTGISTGVGNPFIGKKSDYDALRGLYQQSQPSENTELRVPAGTLDRAYQSTAPAYGPTFPGNPVDIDRKTPAAVALAGMGKPGEEGYVAPSADTATFMALRKGQADAVADEFGRPVTLNVTSANPMTPAEGPVTAPSLAPEAGPVAPTPDEKIAAAQAALESAHRQTNVPVDELATINANTDDPAVAARAIELARSQRASEALPGQAASVLGTIAGYSPLMPGYIPGMHKVIGAIPDIPAGIDSFAEKVRAQKILDEQARAARGLPPLEDFETPQVDYQPGA